ncbi:MAG TPA: glycosyltransferase family 1 protein [Candidatus Limnocylindrales bacterium]|jgi:glycosyltransferase involved in cell wall biosynthesis|nr:glycosyltransferase family 1 protein [Candidatus Limnocylindrales bacterium]HZM10455.1 glycosyltransferase family 1 protein [Candidatus Limnocylindrales bacterium]
MRVLYDHQVFSLQNAGGASRYFYELMNFLSTVPDVQTELLLGISGTVYPFRSLPPAKARVTQLPESLPPGMLRYVANEILGNCAAFVRGTMDIYHLTLFMRMPMVRARRLVATHHDCTHERFPHLFPDVKKVLWARKKLFPEMDAIICVSESCRQDLLQFYAVDPAKTRVIHHGLNPLPRSAEAAASLRQKLRRDYVLYVGMRVAFKNFAGLLKAFHETRLHDSFDLLVLGGGPLTVQEKTLIASLEMSDCLTALPIVSDELLAEAYAGAHLFVYPSLNEGFGFPPLEAMSVGCPVLASQVSSIPEVCQDAPFYFDPMDQGSFNRALLQAVNDEMARQLAVERGKEVVAKYSWDKCGRETLALYRECQ